MTRSLQEKQHTEQFEARYAAAQSPVMRAMERRVCGCDYGANSWTTRDEADDLATRLELGRGVRLLDLGAGSGWPGLYLSGESGCDVVLVDLPFTGLKIAAQRSRDTGIETRTSLALADAAHLPFRDASFDAVNHSDLLCCLRQKRKVLAACRRVIRRRGRMMFTVISIMPNLSLARYRCAAANGPEFVESDTDYAELLEQTGWVITARDDVTAAYAASCRRQIEIEDQHQEELAALFSAAERAERMDKWQGLFAAISDKLLRRELFEAVPT